MRLYDYFLGHRIGRYTGHCQVMCDDETKYAVFTTIKKAEYALKRFRDGSLVLYDHFGRTRLSRREKVSVYRKKKYADDFKAYKSNP